MIWDRSAMQKVVQPAIILQNMVMERVLTVKKVICALFLTQLLNEGCSCTPMVVLFRSWKTKQYAAPDDVTGSVWASNFWKRRRKDEG